MSSVDDRIVNMQFNNKQFQSGVTETQRSLEGLERSLGNTANSKGLDTMGQGVDKISTKFSALQIAGVSALATIASKATSAGLNLVKGLTIDPLIAGFQEYELNLKSVQTVVANTGLSVKKVGVYMDELNEYSDQTIYNFGQMAQNIGRFTAAGVEVDVATQAIKGMANSAALAGADTNQLNSAMYQMSQALSSGTIRLMDWNSLVNANMGGQNIQESLMATAMTMGEAGTAMQAAQDKAGNFRDSLQEGWLTADIYTKTMKVMAGQINETTGKTEAFSVAQLKNMGYTQKAAEDLHKLSGAAIESATKIKTFTQLIDVVKESIGSGFAQVFERLFGNLKQAGDLFTGIGDKITGAIGTVFTAIDKMLAGWQRAGGYEAMWNGFGNIFQTIGNLLKPFVMLFQALFPATNDAGKGLANASKGFESVTEWMEKATSNVDYLIPAFTKFGEAVRWVFGHLGSLVAIGGKVTSFLGDLASKGASIATDLLGGLLGGLNPGAVIQAMKDLASDIITSIKGALGIASPARELIPVGNDIVLGIAKGVGDGIMYVIASLDTLLPMLISFGAKAITALALVMVEGVKSLAIGVLDVIGKVAPALGAAIASIGGAAAGTLTKVGEGTSTAWQGVGAVFGALGDTIKGVFGSLGDAVSFVTDKLFGLFRTGGGDALGWAAFLNTVLVGGILLTIRKFMRGIASITGIITQVEAIFKSIAGAIGDFGDSLKTRARAELIRSVAIAIGILAASLFLLSFVDTDKLTIGLGSIAAMLALLTATLFALSKIDGGFNMVAMSASMVLMATAILILSSAVAILGNMDMKTLAKGLGSIAIGIGILVAAMLVLDKMKGSVEGMAASILVLAIAMNAMALAVGMLGNMDMGTLAKGLGAMAIGLGLLVAAMIAMDRVKGSVEGMAASILILALAMNAMALAVGALGNMDMKTLAKGLGAMAIGLGLLVAAMLAMDMIKGSVEGLAASIFVIASAMVVLSLAVGAFGNMDMETLAKGLGAMAIGLGLIILAAWGAQLVAPGLAALSAVMLAFGAAVALAGAGMLMFGTGFAIMTAAGIAGVAVLSAAIMAFIALLPNIALQVAASFVVFVETIAAAAPRIRDAFSTIFKEMIGVVKDNMEEIGKLITKLFDTILDIAIKATPKFGKLIQVLINTGIRILRQSIPQWIDLGFLLINKFLNAAEEEVPKIARSASNIVTKFLDTMTLKLPKIIRSGTDLVVAFIEGIGENAVRLARAALDVVINFIDGITAAIEEKDGELRDAGFSMAWAIADGMSLGLLGKGKDLVMGAVHSLTGTVEKGVKYDFGINSPSKLAMTWGWSIGEGMSMGIIRSIHLAVSAATQMANAVIVAGDKAVAGVQSRAAKEQTKANELNAKATITENRARLAAREAAEFAKKNKDKKAAIKKREKEAAELQKLAEKQRVVAEKAQQSADRAEAAVTATQTFQNADDVGKGDIKNQRAIELADRANLMLAKANAEALEAKRLMKVSKDAGRKMLEQAQKDAKAARKLADQAKEASRQANAFYRSELRTRLQAMQDAAAEDAASEAYDAADDPTKANILFERARANEARAKEAQERAQQLVLKAQQVARKDAARSLRLLALAEQATAEAKEAASDAKSETSQAQQILNQIEQAAQQAAQAASSGSDSSGPDPIGQNTIVPSRSVLEQAARTVDRYTSSLAMASELAAAQSGPVQFTQNNYSPESLSTSEIYRQNKNLLAAAQIKMGVNTTSTA